MKKETTKKQKQDLEQNIKVKTLKQNTKSNTKTNQGITLIALVITIVLNCCKAAMERMLKNVNILKISEISDIMRYVT